MGLSWCGLDGWSSIFLDLDLVSERFADESNIEGSWCCLSEEVGVGWGVCWGDFL